MTSSSSQASSKRAASVRTSSAGILPQAINQPEQAIGLFEIGQINQRNTSHTGVFSGQPRLQIENVLVIGHSKK